MSHNIIFLLFISFFPSTLHIRILPPPHLFLHTVPPLHRSQSRSRILYKNKPLQSVWVANRNNPVSLSLCNTSLLQLTNGTLSLIINSLPIRTLPSPSKATQALLLDTRNFILRNASAVVWQGFDHPSGAWLPDAPINLQIKLTSWTKPDDPDVLASSYSLEMESNSNELLLKKKQLTGLVLKMVIERCIV